MPAAELPACVFCGQPIGPGEETAGRAPMAAHAACADAALADDAHWEQISAAGGENDQEPAVRPATRSAGCLAVGLLALALLTAFVLIV